MSWWFLLLLSALVVEPSDSHIIASPAAINNRSLGRACTDTIDCAVEFGVHSGCVHGVCECQQNAHYNTVGMSCYETALLGDQCRLNYNCVATPTNVSAYCEKGVCECPFSHHSSGDRTTCLKTIKLDGLCSQDAECLVNDSNCRDVCRCSVNYIASVNLTACLRRADRLGEDCEVDAQCSANIKSSVCAPSSLTCHCAAGYHNSSKSSCIRSIGHNEICRKSSECWFGNSSLYSLSVCQDGRCQCQDGYEINLEYSGCVPITTNGSGLLPYNLVLLVITYLFSVTIK